jgi:hypothetical protein
MLASETSNSILAVMILSMKLDANCYSGTRRESNFFRLTQESNFFAHGNDRGFQWHAADPRPGSATGQ